MGFEILPRWKGGFRFGNEKGQNMLLNQGAWAVGLVLFRERRG